MKTTRGTIGYWACMVIGIAILCLQGYKYANDTLHLDVSELGLCIVAVALIFAPKTLSQAFGKLLNSKLGSNTQRADSVPPTGPKKPPKS